MKKYNKNVKSDEEILDENNDKKQQEITLKGNNNCFEETAGTIYEKVDNQPIAKDIGKKQLNNPDEKEEITRENEKQESNRETSFEKAVEAGNKLVEKANNCIREMFEKYFKNSAFSLSENEVCLNFKKYIQSLLLVNSLKDGKASEIQIEFLYNLLRDVDIFEGMDSTLATLKKASAIVSNIPSAILMAVAIDKKHGQSNSKVLSEIIYSIYKIMCMLSNEEPLEKNKVLGGIVSFALFQGVTI